MRSRDWIRGFRLGGFRCHDYRVNTGTEAIRRGRRQLQIYRRQFLYSQKPADGPLSLARVDVDTVSHEMWVKVPELLNIPATFPSQLSFHPAPNCASSVQSEWFPNTGV